MKRQFIILALGLLLASCNNNGNNTQSQEKKSETTSQNVVAAAQAPQKEEVKEQEAKLDKVEFLSFKKSENKNNFSISIQMLEPKQGCKKFNKYVYGNDLPNNEYLLDKITEIQADLFDGMEAAMDDVPEMNHEQIVEEVLNKNQIATVEVIVSGYYGGAHELNYTNYYTYDFQKDQAIAINDIFDCKKLAKKVVEKLKVQEGSQEMELDEMDKKLSNFFINNNSLTIYFNVYEIAPYVYGPIQASISYNDLQNCIIDKNLAKRLFE